MAKTTNQKNFMISCKEATMLSVQKAEIKISFEDRLRLFVHLLICQYCRWFNKQNKIINHLLSNFQINKKLSNEQKIKLQNEIEKELK